MNYIFAVFDLFNEMAPYLLLGFLFAGILHVFFPVSKVQRYLGQNNFSSVVNASLIGIPLPLCSCGVIPTGVSFHKNGASKGSTVSFLISTPQTGIDSILVTYSLLGLPFAIIRPIISFFTGILGGVVSNRITRNDKINVSALNSSCQNSGKSTNVFIRMFRYAFVTFLQDIQKWLIIGILLAGLIEIIIPDNFFETTINNDLQGMFLLLLVSVPLYVCATASVPIAAVLMLKGLSPGAALVFLMAGPATNIATITVIAKVFGRKTFFTYLLSIVGGSLLFGLAINEFLPREWFLIQSSEHLAHSHFMLPQWLQYGLSSLLILLMLNGFILKNKSFFKSIINKNKCDMEKLKVKGMSCNHCKMNVEKNLLKFEEVTKVEVDLSQGIVKIAGDNLDLTKIKNKIEELGYEINE